MNQNNIVCGAIVSVCVVVGFCWRAGILSMARYLVPEGELWIGCLYRTLM